MKTLEKHNVRLAGMLAMLKLESPYEELGETPDGEKAIAQIGEKVYILDGWDGIAYQDCHLYPQDKAPYKKYVIEPMYDIQDDEIVLLGHYVKGIVQDAVNLKILRKRAGLSVAELAERSGVGESTLKKLEAGERDINKMAGESLYSTNRKFNKN